MIWLFYHVVYRVGAGGAGNEKIVQYSYSSHKYIVLKIPYTHTHTREQGARTQKVPEEE